MDGWVARSQIQCQLFCLVINIAMSNNLNTLMCTLHNFPVLKLDLVIQQGRPQDLGGGGGQEIFFSDLGICMSRSDMLRMAKPCALLGGFGGMLPRENFLKRCNLVRFRVYFDQILSLFFSKKYHFLYKK